MTASRHVGVVTLLCVAETLSMAGFATFPALLAPLSELWRLSATEAGVIAGAYFAGYLLAVPLLSGLTDRADTRRVYLGACFIGATGSAGFALFATGPLTAALFQALAGAGLAGTYMPGLKALTERVGGPRQSRYVAFYTSTFGIGTSVSLLLAGGVAGTASWQLAFGLAALGPLAAGALVLIGLAPHPPIAGHLPGGGRRWRRLLADRAVAGYVAGYAAHCWELFGLRSWMVAFCAFAWALQPDSASLPAPAAAAALVNLLGIPASILGNEAAMRLGRRRLIVGVMAASGALAWVAGFAPNVSAAAAFLMLAIYYLAVMADSAALTAGLVAAAAPAERGAAMAVYSAAGFGAGFVGPLAFGAVLDLAGGREEILAWGLAFGSLGLGCALAPLVSRPRRAASTAGNHPEEKP